MKIYCLKGLKSFYENNENTINNFISNDYEGSAKFFAVFENSALFIKENNVFYNAIRNTQIEGDMSVFMETVEEIENCLIVTHIRNGVKVSSYLPICQIIKDNVNAAIEAGNDVSMTTLKEYNNNPIEVFDEEKALEEIKMLLSNAKEVLSDDEYNSIESIVKELELLSFKRTTVKSLEDGEFKDMCLNSIKNEVNAVKAKFKSLFSKMINNN